MNMVHRAALPVVDLVLRSGRILTFADADQGPGECEAIAIAAGRVVAIGTDEQLAPLTALAERVVDLAGRRVLPGLNDSHIHAVRAANSWNQTMHWEDVRSVEQALERVGAEARRRGPGAWVSAIGGWHRTQLAQGRVPTRAELDAVAPDNPVFIEELYDRGILNTAGLRACGFADDSPDPARGVLVREDGRLTGEVRGVGAFAIAIAKALTSDEDPAHGVRAMNAVFAAHGLTGVVDGGGLLMTPRDYDALYSVWREQQLEIRTRLFISAWNRGGEVADVDALTTLVQPDSGDGLLRVVGVGEIPHLGCHDMEGFDDFSLSQTAFEELTQIVRMCATRGWRMSVHAVLDETLSRILDAWEAVQAETGLVAGRHWSIVHADGASRRNLERLARLDAGILIQNRLLLKGGDYVDAWGEEATACAPPIADMLELGIVLGGGTDATRANWFSPWAAIAWMVTGGTLDGRGVRDSRHRLSRPQALASYTRDASWCTAELATRGRLLPGYDADLCVPTLDPLTCAEEDLAQIRSDLTVMAGRATYDSGALDTAPLERSKEQP